MYQFTFAAYAKKATMHSLLITLFVKFGKG